MTDGGKKSLGKSLWFWLRWFTGFPSFLRVSPGQSDFGSDGSGSVVLAPWALFLLSNGEKGGAHDIGKALWPR